MVGSMAHAGRVTKILFRTIVGTKKERRRKTRGDAEEKIMDILKTLHSLLGEFVKHSDNNYSFKCQNPMCPSLEKESFRKQRKLSITLKDGVFVFHCWVCDKSGFNFRDLYNVFPIVKKNVLKQYGKLIGCKTHSKVKSKGIKNDKIEEDYFNNINRTLESSIPIQLLKEISVLKDVYNTIYKYLTIERGLTNDDIETFDIRWQRKSDFLLIPAYDLDNGGINYFIKRRFRNVSKESRNHYKPSNCGKVGVLPFINYVNFMSDYLILVEGIFDVIKGTHQGLNILPIMGNQISRMFVISLITKLIEENSKIKNIFLLMDSDRAGNKTKYSNLLLCEQYGFNTVSLLEMDSYKDLGKTPYEDIDVWRDLWDKIKTKKID